MTPTEIADLVVPEYRVTPRLGKYPPCHGVIAKRWNAAYLAAELAMGLVTDEMVEAGANALSKLYHGDNTGEPFSMMARAVLTAAKIRVVAV